MTADRTWFVTGCSSGFGRELAHAIVERGERVVASARRPSALRDLAASAPDRILTPELDVTDPDQIQRAVDAAVETFGQIDVLVNNAGYVLVGGLEEVDADEYRKLFDTNFFGAVAVTQAVLPIMRRQRRGHVINVSSMGGISGGLGMAFYGATKFGLAAISESLAQEAAPLGIKVTIVEPGGFNTRAISGATYSRRAIAEYELVAAHRRRMGQRDGSSLGDPGRVANAILTVADAESPPLHLPLGRDAIARLDRKLEVLTSDRERWLDLSLSTTD